MADKSNPVRTRFAWLDQVATDRAAPPLGLAVAVVLCRWLGADGSAWPSVGTVAAALGTTDRSVQRTLAALELGGHVVVDRNGGRGRTNRISLVLKRSPNDGNGDVSVTVQHSERVTKAAGKGDKSSPKGCQPCHPNHYRTRGTALAVPSEPGDRLDARAPSGAALGDLTRPDATPADEIEAAMTAGEITPAEAAFMRRNRRSA